MILTSVILGCIASLQFGIQSGNISGALLYLPASFPEAKDNAFLTAFVVASFILGAFISSFGFSSIADKFGRKPAILTIHAVTLISSVAVFLAPSIHIVILCRFIMGLAVGGTTTLIPLYLSEISPAEIRGKIGSSIQISVAIGSTGSFLMSYACTFYEGDPWRLMLSLSGLLSLIPLSCSAFITESPRYLVKIGRIDKAKECLRINGIPNDDIDFQLSLITASTRNASGQNVSWKRLFRFCRKPALLSAGTYVMQQFSGINLFIYYSATTFEGIGFDKKSSLLASAVSAAPQILMLFVSSLYLDTLGRKVPFMLSHFLMGMCLLLFGLNILFHIETVRILSVLILLLAKVVYSIGVGVVPHILSAELLPNKFRAKGMAFSSGTKWLCNSIVSFSFPPLAQLELSITKRTTPVYIYILYMMFNFISCLMIYIFYEETKNTVIDEVIDDYSSVKEPLLNNSEE